MAFAAPTKVITYKKVKKRYLAAHAVLSLEMDVPVQKYIQRCVNQSRRLQFPSDIGTLNNYYPFLSAGLVACHCQACALGNENIAPRASFPSECEHTHDD